MEAEKLKIKIGDIVFKNPILTASGTSGYGDELIPVTNVNLYGGIITKSLTLQPRKGNPPPRIVETPSGMINSIGLANIGVKRFINEKLPILHQLQTNLIVNVAGKEADEYFQVIELLEKEKGICGYELNFSCPNVKEGGIEFGKQPEVVEKLTAKARKLTERLLIVKLTPNVTSIEEIALAAQEGGADAVSMINTVYGMAIDVHRRRPLINTIIGGLSGPAIKPIALACVYRTYQKVDLPIIGIGGITSATDVVEFLLAGATLVQLGTIHFKHPAIIEKIVPELYTYLEEHKLNHISQLIGAIDV